LIETWPQDLMTVTEKARNEAFVCFWRGAICIIGVWRSRVLLEVKGYNIVGLVAAGIWIASILSGRCKEYLCKITYKNVTKWELWPAVSAV